MVNLWIGMAENVLAVFRPGLLVIDSPSVEYDRIWYTIVLAESTVLYLNMLLCFLDYIVLKLGWHSSPRPNGILKPVTHSLTSSDPIVMKLYW